MTKSFESAGEPGKGAGQQAGRDAVASERTSARQRTRPTGNCAWCRRALPEQRGPGRPRKFCSQRCRQWDWVSRQRARELALSEGELVIARAQLDALHDDLYVLACAVDDVERDLGASGRRTLTELHDALGWLLDAARPLRDRELAPSAPTPPG